MKKILAVLFIFMLTMNIFAVDVTPTAVIRLDVGANVQLGDKYPAGNPGGDPTWNFNPFNNGTSIGVNAAGDNAGGWIHIRGNEHVYLGDTPGTTGTPGIFGEAWVNIGPTTLTIGRSEAWAQWNSISLFGDIGWAFGASASTDNPFIKLSVEGFYFGLSEAGVNGKYIGSKASVAPGDNAPFPGFFVGYDYAADAFSVGATFAGQYVGDDVDDGSFPLMFNVHGKIPLDPITLGLNVAFYIAPENAPGLFSINSAPENLIKGVGKSRVIEAMIDLSAAFDPCDIGFSGAFIMDTEAESYGFKTGACATFGISGTGFSIIPGLIYTNILKIGGNDAKKSWLDVGVSCSYSY